MLECAGENNKDGEIDTENKNMGIYVADVFTEDRRTDYLIDLIRDSGVNIKVKLASVNPLDETLPMVVCILGSGLDTFKVMSKDETELGELVDLFFREDISENSGYRYLNGIAGAEIC